jgi:phosphoribosylanthranilate isomerase
VVIEGTKQTEKKWVKICGIKNPAIMESLSELKPDALGFNFYEKSVRYVEPDLAREMISRLPVDILPVGLFVNHQVDEIKRICDIIGVNTIQLHGDESPSEIAKLKEYRIIRAVRLSFGQGLSELVEENQRLEDVGVRPFTYLLDKRSSAGYGGTGETLAWEMLAKEYDHVKFPPMILAGGLTPENVREAMIIAKPFGVDVASGVEDSPGVKSIDLCRKFLAQARETT